MFHDKNECNHFIRKYIVDALSQCGTLDCAEFMISTITDKKVGTSQSVQFLTGIALVGKPSEDMVGNVLFFCQETPSRTAFLTLGTLMHKYCNQHSCDNLVGCRLLLPRLVSNLLFIWQEFTVRFLHLIC